MKRLQIEELISLVSSMDHASLTRQLLAFQGNFPVDFNVDFLNQLSVERLRHIYVALCLQNEQTPLTPELAA